MKSILSGATRVLKTGLAVKGIAEKLLSPVIAVRNFIKKMLIKAIVMIVKQAIRLSLKDGVDANTNRVVRQLNALTDSNADMNGLNKTTTFKVTLDTLLEKADDISDYKMLNLIDLTNVKNKISAYKNSLRNDAYDYVVENNFTNIKSLVESANEILKTPTDVIGCEFATCSIQVESHDQVAKDFVLIFDVCFALKSQK